METFKIGRTTGSWYDAETLEEALEMFFDSCGEGTEGLRCWIFWEREYWREFGPNRIAAALQAIGR
jgi:hypothetical protein